MRPDYLIHFNGNHSSKNGQFISGDGDHDGIIDDHHHYRSNRVKKSTGSISRSSGAKNKVFNSDNAKKAAIGTVAVAAAAVTAAVIIRAVNKDKSNVYALEADSGRAWIEAGDLYKSSKAKFVGGDW